jgi:hypothetical protein
MKYNAAFADYKDCFEELADLTMPVAFFATDPVELEKTVGLTFLKGYDDLDYVLYTILDLPIAKLALVFHERSLEQGIEICVNPHCKDISEIIKVAAEFLKIGHEQIKWVHPLYETVFRLKVPNAPKK